MDPSSIANLNVDTALTTKAIFGFHFVLVSFAMMGHWIPEAYGFYNIFFLAFLIWSQIATDADYPLTNALVANVFGIVFDIIVMSVRYNPEIALSIDKFSLGMAILNLIGRLVSTFLLYRIREQRKSMVYGNVGGEPRSGLAGYEDLPSGFNDRPNVHSPIDTKPLAP